jgi:hypothetical protein
LISTGPGSRLMKLKMYGVVRFGDGGNLLEPSVRCANHHPGRMPRLASRSFDRFDVLQRHVLLFSRLEGG